MIRYLFPLAIAVLPLISGCSSGDQRWAVQADGFGASEAAGTTQSCGDSLYVFTSASADRSGQIAVYEPKSSAPSRTVRTAPPHNRGASSPFPWSLAVDSTCNLYALVSPYNLYVYPPGSGKPARTIRVTGLVWDLALDGSDDLFYVEYRALGAATEIADGHYTHYRVRWGGPLVLDSGSLFVAGATTSGQPIINLFRPPSKTVVKTLAIGGKYPVALAVDAAHNLDAFAASNAGENTIVSEYNSGGQFVRSFLLRGITIGNGLQEVAFDRRGSLYVADATSGSVFVYDKANPGKARRISVAGMAASAILLDAADNLYVASEPKSGNGSIYVFASYSDRLTRTIQQGVATPNIALTIGPN